MSVAYVYIYTDPQRGEPIYVGKGYAGRWEHHLSRRDRHPLVQRLQAMKREGVTPTINIVPCACDADALTLEVQTIARLGRKDLGKGPLLNLTDGGDGASGWVMPEATKHKISKAKVGKPLTAEHKQRISVSGRQRPPISEETRRRSSQARKRWHEERVAQGILWNPRAKKSLTNDPLNNPTN